MSGNGNVSRRSERKKTEDIQTGDYVKITNAAFEKVRTMSPIDLFHTGWPNEFLVIAVFEHEGVRCLRLDPCCGWLRNRATGQYLCEGHPVEYFEKTDPLTHEKSKDDRHFSLEVLGQEAVSADFSDKGRNPSLSLKVPGIRHPIILSGKVAKDLSKMAQDLGVF